MQLNYHEIITVTLEPLNHTGGVIMLTYRQSLVWNWLKKTQAANTSKLLSQSQALRGFCYSHNREVLCNKSSNLIDKFFSYSDNEQFVLFVNIHINMLSQFIENAYNKRKRKLYNWLRLYDE